MREENEIDASIGSRSEKRFREETDRRGRSSPFFLEIEGTSWIRWRTLFGDQKVNSKSARERDRALRERERERE